MVGVDDGDNDYDPSTDDLENETPTPDAVINQAIETKLYDLHTGMPGKIVAVKGNNRVDVQPLIMRKFNDGSVKPLPVLQDVLVYMPSGADYWVKLPVAVDDVGEIRFAERSLDIWSVQGGTVDPADSRRHHLSDGIFYPGLRPFNAQIPGDAADMVLHNGGAEVYLKKDGTFKLTNGTNELFAILDQLLQTLSTASTVVGGPFTPDVVELLEQYQEQIDSLKG